MRVRRARRGSDSASGTLIAETKNEGAAANTVGSFREVTNDTRPIDSDEACKSQRPSNEYQCHGAATFADPRTASWTLANGKGNNAVPHVGASSQF